jgi:hypothetical protein
MRTPSEYITDMAEDVLVPFKSDISNASLAANDQYHAEMQRIVRNVGLNPDSLGFKASVLVACDLLDGLANSLLESEVEDNEMGAWFIHEASARLRLLSLWGERPCPKKDCLDLR